MAASTDADRSKGSPGRIQNLLNLDSRRYDVLARCTRNFFSELLATGSLVFLGCMGTVRGLGQEANHTGGVLAFSLAAYTAIQIGSHNSGGHINPAVTVVSVFFKKVSYPMACLYVVAQALGGILGFGLLVLVTPPDALEVNEGEHGICTTFPNPLLGIGQALVAEFSLTCILMLIVCTGWDPRNSSHDSLTLKFGFTIYSLAYAGISYSGCSMNPARSLGPAVWNNSWHHHWIYWVGPLGAAVVCGYLYTTFLCPPVEDPVKPQETRNWV